MRHGDGTVGGSRGGEGGSADYRVSIYIERAQERIRGPWGWGKWMRSKAKERVGKYVGEHW